MGRAIAGIGRGSTNGASELAFNCVRNFGAGAWDIFWENAADTVASPWREERLVLSVAIEGGPLGVILSETSRKRRDAGTR